MTLIPPAPAVTASRRELARGVGIALSIAAVLLTIAVLPAEYGIDPTGIGGALGLTALRGPMEKPARDPVPPSVAPVAPVATKEFAGGTGTIAARQTTPYRSDTRSVTLPPGKGLEVKTHLEKGAALIYSWKTENGAIVDTDFHGEPADAKGDEFESFIKDSGIRESRGALIAPFTGTHGWYWRNRTDAPVVVVLNASGFYSDIFAK